MFRRLMGRLAPSTQAPTGRVEGLVVGLGNPGREYENTRHNAGFLAIDRIAKSCGADLSRLKFQSQIGDAMIGGHRVLLMKPSTFMNRSGIAVKEASDFYKIPPERILVIFDDIALPVGRMRIRRSGSDGGQRGMQNILYLMGVDTLPRIRLGIGAKPHPDYDLKDWVLSRFSDTEWQHLGPILDTLPDAVTLILEGRIDEAMGKYNGFTA